MIHKHSQAKIFWWIPVHFYTGDQEVAGFLACCTIGLTAVQKVRPSQTMLYEMTRAVKNSNVFLCK